LVTLLKIKLGVLLNSAALAARYHSLSADNGHVVGVHDSPVYLLLTLHYVIQVKVVVVPLKNNLLR